MKPAETSASDCIAIRLLLMDPQRRHVLLVQESQKPGQESAEWMLPCGQPNNEEPRAFLNTLIDSHLPPIARSHLFAQMDQSEPEPVAWIYPPAAVLPYATQVLQVVYLFSLRLEAVKANETTRFWPVEALPEHTFPLEDMIIKIVRFAESRHALPIDMRQSQGANDLTTSNE